MRGASTAHVKACSPCTRTAVTSGTEKYVCSAALNVSTSSPVFVTSIAVLSLSAVSVIEYCTEKAWGQTFLVASESFRLITKRCGQFEGTGD